MLKQILPWVFLAAELTFFTLWREGHDVLWSWLFGDIAFRGRRVTFVNALEDVIQGRVTLRAWNDDKHVMYVHYRDETGSSRTASVPVNARGITWCYGWSGRDVDALRAQAALIRSAA